MFNNSLSVLSRAAARFKKIVLFAELVIQIMFIGYYAYNIVVHHEDLVLLIGYSVLAGLGLIIFFVMLFTLDPYQKRVQEFKKSIRRVIRVISWTGKLTVIGYNIYYLIRFGLTETGHLLLIFSIIIFLTEVVLFIVSSILSYYYQLFVYALQMDYQNLIGESQVISDKPIGRILLNINGSVNRQQDVTALFIEQEIYEAIKKYSEKNEGPLNRRKMEKRLLAYYNDSFDYYQDNNKLADLYKEVNQINVESDEYHHLLVLKFFLANQVEKTYVGLSEECLRFALSGLAMFKDYKTLQVVDIVYSIIIKHLVNNKDWNKLVTTPTNTQKKSIFSIFKSKEVETPNTVSGGMFNEVNEIVSKSIKEAELELKKTVSGEIEGIVSETIKKKVSGSIKSRIKGFFIRKKK